MFIAPLCLGTLLLVILVLPLLLLSALLLVILVLPLMLLSALLLIILILPLLLLSTLLLVVLILPLLLLSMLLVVLVLPLLLLSTLLLVVLVLPLLLLSALLLVVLVLPLLLLGTPWLLLLLVRLPLLLSMSRVGLSLLAVVLLFLGVVLPLAVLLLRVGRSSDCEKQRQDGCAGDSNRFHRCSIPAGCTGLLLAQASCCCVDRIADGLTGYEKLYPAVLLPSGGVTVSGYRQSVAETSCGHRGGCYALLHQVIAD